jgi:lipopolysaccharide export system protein LptA
VKKLLLGLGLVVLSALPAMAKTEPMDIVAKSTEYNGSAHTYTVSGDVHIAFRAIKVTCRKAIIYFTPKEDKVTRIVFMEDVEVLRGQSTFQGRQVTYYVADQRLVAEGGTKTRINLAEVKGP